MLLSAPCPSTKSTGITSGIRQPDRPQSNGIGEVVTNGSRPISNTNLHDDIDVSDVDDVDDIDVKMLDCWDCCGIEVVVGAAACLILE